MADLTPCPFCAADAEYLVVEESEDHDEAWVLCEECLACGPVAMIGCRDPDDPDEDPIDLKAEAFEMWCDRKEDEAIALPEGATEDTPHTPFGCPFCGERDDAPTVDRDDDTGDAYVECGCCGARGPIAMPDTDEDEEEVEILAIGEWDNRRNVLWNAPESGVTP